MPSEDPSESGGEHEQLAGMLQHHVSEPTDRGSVVRMLEDVVEQLEEPLGGRAYATGDTQWVEMAIDVPSSGLTGIRNESLPEGWVVHSVDIIDGGAYLVVKEPQEAMLHD